MEEAADYLEGLRYSLAVAGPAFGMAFGEALFIYIHRTIAVNFPWGGSFLYYGSILICALCCVVPWLLILSLPKQKWLVFLSSISLLFYIEFRFRGSFIWSGTFDNDTPGLTTMAYPIAVSAIVAVLIALAFRGLKRRTNLLMYGVLLLSICALAASTIHSITKAWIVSEFAFSRHFALYGLAAAVPLAALMIYKFEGDK